MNQGQPNIALQILVLVLIVWAIFWKGVALWRAAHNKQRNWFIVMLILPPDLSLGILELIYLFRFCHKKLTIDEVKSWFSRGKR